MVLIIQLAAAFYLSLRVLCVGATDLVSQPCGDCVDYYTQLSTPFGIDWGLWCGSGPTSAFRRFGFCYDIEIDCIEYAFYQCEAGAPYQIRMYELERSADLTFANLGTPIWSSNGLKCTEDWSAPDGSGLLTTPVDWASDVASTVDPCNDIVIEVESSGSNGLAVSDQTDYIATSYMFAPVCGIVEPTAMGGVTDDSNQYIINLYACADGLPLQCAVDDGICEYPDCTQCNDDCQLDKEECLANVVQPKIGLKKKECKTVFKDCIDSCDECCCYDSDSPDTTSDDR